MTILTPTAHHTTGPFFPAQFLDDVGQDLLHAVRMTDDDARSSIQVVHLSGRVIDGVGAPVVNAIVEIWQPDAAGNVVSRGALSAHDSIPTGFRGWGRTWTDVNGVYQFRTVKPGIHHVAGTDWRRPPHINVRILGSGIMRPLVTQLFFPDEPLNDADRQLAVITDPAVRARLIARAEPVTPTADGAHSFVFDIVLRGAGETPFFED